VLLALLLAACVAFLADELCATKLLAVLDTVLALVNCAICAWREAICDCSNCSADVVDVVDVDDDEPADDDSSLVSCFSYCASSFCNAASCEALEPDVE